MKIKKNNYKTNTITSTGSTENQTNQSIKQEKGLTDVSTWPNTPALAPEI